MHSQCSGAAVLLKPIMKLEEKSFFKERVENYRAANVEPHELLSLGLWHF